MTGKGQINMNDQNTNNQNTNNEKVAIVTGGSRGIGKSICVQLSKQHVIIHIIFKSDTGSAAEAVDEIKAIGGKVFIHQVDITNEDEVKKCVEQIHRLDGHIDYLVNNAGITKDTPFFMMKEENWIDVIESNLVGTILCTQCVLKYMIKARYGRIVNLSSVSGIIGSTGQTNYAASKAGIIGFTRAIAVENAKYDILVNAVAPGFVETDMVHKLYDKHRQMFLQQLPIKRFAQTEEVAELVFFLLCTNYITGQTVSIDAGLTLI